MADNKDPGGPVEPFKLNSLDISNTTHRETEEMDQVNTSTANLSMDVVDERQEPLTKVRIFYFCKYPSFEDRPDLKAKVEHANTEIQKMSRVRLEITEALEELRFERSQVISKLKWSTNLGNDTLKWHLMELGVLEAALGKLGGGNGPISREEEGMGLCFSEEELNHKVQILCRRIQKGSNNLVKERQLLRELKLLEGTREEVIAACTATEAKIHNRSGEKKAIEDRIKLLGFLIDGETKRKQAAIEKRKHLEKDLKTIDVEISPLKDGLITVNKRKEKAYETLNELSKSHDEEKAESASSTRGKEKVSLQLCCLLRLVSPQRHNQRRWNRKRRTH